MIIATFVDACGTVIVSAQSRDYLAAIDRAYTKLMQIPTRPPCTVTVRVQ